MTNIKEEKIQELEKLVEITQIELNKIYNEDCLIGMKKLPNNCIDRVLTSPPYNIIRPNSTDRGYDLYKDGMSNEEYSKWCCDIFNEFDRIVKPNGCVLWNMSYGTENTECMSLTIADIIRNTNFTLADIIVWKKHCATPNNVSHNKLTRICEYVYVFCRRDEFMTFTTNKKDIAVRESGQLIYENIFNFIEAKNNDESTDLNKATFSSDFASKLLRLYAKKFEIIIDPFMGTGTTAISSIENNMFFIGYELSDKQCKYANERIANRLAKLTLFDELDYSKKYYAKNSQ